MLLINEDLVKTVFGLVEIQKKKNTKKYRKEGNSIAPPPSHFAFGICNAV